MEISRLRAELARVTDGARHSTRMPLCTGIDCAYSWIEIDLRCSGQSIGDSVVCQGVIEQRLTVCSIRVISKPKMQKQARREGMIFSYANQ